MRNGFLQKKLKIYSLLIVDSDVTRMKGSEGSRILLYSHQPSQSGAGSPKCPAAAACGPA